MDYYCPKRGFLSWDIDSAHVDLESELQALIAQAPEGEEARNGYFCFISFSLSVATLSVIISPGEEKSKGETLKEGQRGWFVVSLRISPSKGTARLGERATKK
uniref:Uncharacterized protein n=1 Tax=Timema shepardi TaxID=629360 RepID=A0A7R9AUV1_TIMSH|nr:unnamed protein product [Timema shepardi]